MTEKYYYKYEPKKVRPTQISETNFYEEMVTVIDVCKILGVSYKISSVIEPTAVDGVIRIVSTFKFDEADRGYECFLYNHLPTFKSVKKFYGWDFHVGDEK
jgi:hypothetical protein